jgi:hypothetical protein
MELLGGSDVFPGRRAWPVSHERMGSVRLARSLAGRPRRVVQKSNSYGAFATCLLRLRGVVPRLYRGNENLKMGTWNLAAI